MKQQLKLWLVILKARLSKEAVPSEVSLIGFRKPTPTEVRYGQSLAAEIPQPAAFVDKDRQLGA
jgi:hypothetical protein